MTTPDTISSGPRIGIAPDSWGVWNPVDAVQPPPEQYLREVAEAGYHWTELGPYGYLGTDAVALADSFAQYDLELSGATLFTGLHRGPEAVEEAWLEAKDVAGLTSSLGAQHLIVIPELWQRGADGHVVGRRDFDADQWSAFLAGHDELGKRLREEFGIAQQFHSHAESPIGTYREVARLVEGTDPRFVNLCLDTGHFAYYLGDCVRLIQEFGDRIGYLHLKQVAPGILHDVLKNDVDFATAVQRGVMTEPPHGEPAFAPVLDESAKTTSDIFAIVEQDMYPVASFDDPLPIARRTHRHIGGCGARVRFQ